MVVRPMVALTLVALAAAGPAPEPTSPGLGLEDAVRLSLASHEDPKLAALAIERAEAQRRETWARIFPTVVVSGTVAQRPGAASVDLNGVPTVIQEQTGLNAIGKATTTLFDVGAIPDLTRAGRQVEAQRLESSEQRRALAFAVAEQFLTTLAQDQLLAAAQKRHEVARETVGDARARVQAGIGRPGDVTRAELERSAAALEVIGAERGLAVARLQLGLLLGPGNERRAQGELLAPDAAALAPEEDELAALGLDDLRRRARGERLDLQTARTRALAAHDATWENRLGFVPRIDAVAQVIAQNETGIGGRNVDWSLALVATWTLLNGGARFWRTDELDATARIGDLEADRLQRQIDIDVERTLLELGASRRELAETETRAALASHNLDETRALFTAGLATALEQVDAIGNAFAADAALARQRLITRLSRLALSRTLGDWPAGSAP